MPQDDRDRPKLFRSQVQAWEEHGDLLSAFRPEPDEKDATIGGLRRQRRRAANDTDLPIKTVSLIERDGVLFWCDDIPDMSNGVPAKLDIGPRRRRLRRRAGLPTDEAESPPEMEDGSLVLARTFPALAPNQVSAAIGAIDHKLNDSLDKTTLAARLRPLQRANGGLSFELGGDVGGSFSGRTLLFVHGTFSNATNMLEEFKASPDGLRFLDAAMNGERRYDHVVFFEHATLAVSPVMNALELGRLFANSSGQVDVIAHSRGGLVVRWWLEAFGKSLAISPEAPVRAVLAGSPLNGTGLAAPANLQHALSLLSNIGSFVEATLKVTGAANPFMWVAGALVQVVVSVTGALAKTPLIDGVVAVIPGLAGQSRVSNNHEINRLRLGPCAVDPRYHAVQSDFRATEPGWKFWRYFRKDVLADKVTSMIFDGANDLVVDTDSMIDFGVPHLQLTGEPYNFRTNNKVWHCNYFRQPETIKYINDSFP